MRSTWPYPPDKLASSTPGFPRALQNLLRPGTEKLHILPGNSSKKRLETLISLWKLTSFSTHSCIPPPMPVCSIKALACQRGRLSRFTFTSIFAWDLASIRWLTRLHDVSEGERDPEATKTTRCQCPVNHWQNSLRTKVWDTGTRNCRCCFLCVPVHLLHPLAWPAHPTGVTRCCIWWVAEGSGQGWILRNCGWNC